MTTARPRISPVLHRDAMAAMLGRLVTSFYGVEPVPAADGGWFFRAICELRRREDDLFWTERRVTELARELGYWPWSVLEVQTAFRKDPPGEPAPPRRSS
jgi:hypothetical protein